MKRFKGCLGVFLIFFFGVLFGCAITASVIHRKVIELVEGGPEKIASEILIRLKKDLKLDSEQQEMLQQITTDTRIKLRGIRQTTQPQVEQTLDEAAARVRGILNPDQAKKFDEIVTKGREKYKMAESRPVPEKAKDIAPEAPTPATATPSAVPSAKQAREAEGQP